MNPIAALEDPDLLIPGQTDDLGRVAQRIASPLHRRPLYARLAERRELAEPILNAFEARREACPERVTGPLNGLPITVKDQIAVAGWPTSFGLERVSTRPEEHSAGLVARLEALGAHVTGKTALPPHAMDFQTGNRRRGATSNPHDPTYTAGGSSGGGAAAVASGMSLLDVGSDLGGSLRIPAGWCGVASYTPSEGFWPNDGMLRGAQRLAHFARIGLIARTARDLAVIWQALEPSGPAAPARTSPARIALWSPEGPAICDRDTLRGWSDFGRAVRRAYPETTSDPMTTLLRRDVYRVAGEIIGYETGALMPWPIRWILRRDRRASETSPGFVAHVHAGYRRDGARHRDTLGSLADLRARALGDWSTVDALLLPVSGICAFKHVAPERDRNGIRTYDRVFATGAGDLGYFDALTRFTLPITALGWPVVTIPIGFDGNGLPMGAQLVGKPGGDGRLLELASDMQHRLGQR